MKTHQICKKVKCKHLLINRNPSLNTVKYWCKLPDSNAKYLLQHTRDTCVAHHLATFSYGKQTAFDPVPDKCPYALEHTLLKDEGKAT